MGVPRDGRTQVPNTVVEQQLHRLCKAAKWTPPDLLAVPVTSLSLQVRPDPQPQPPRWLKRCAPVCSHEFLVALPRQRSPPPCKQRSREYHAPHTHTQVPGLWLFWKPIWTAALIAMGKTASV